MSTPPSAASGVVHRRPDEPVPDLTDYDVVHRAMTSTSTGSPSRPPSSSTGTTPGA